MLVLESRALHSDHYRARAAASRKVDHKSIGRDPANTGQPPRAVGKATWNLSSGRPRDRGLPRLVKKLAHQEAFEPGIIQGPRR